MENETTYGHEETDVIVYAGMINVLGYNLLCRSLKGKTGKKALLLLATPGGDPNAGFRIARALQHTYEQFGLLVPSYCKSAGTLIAIGAYELFLDDMSELGPLDVQIKKHDELVGRNSGLDIIAAVDYLREQAMVGFHQHCTELVTGAGLSTKAASNIATRLTIGMLKPIAQQIDPMKLAEMQRATDIAYRYGERLNEKSQNLLKNGLGKLIAGYPSHGFVIDRKEAKTIFERVSKPRGMMNDLSSKLHAELTQHMSSKRPFVTMLKASGTENENLSDSPRTQGSNSAGNTASTELHKDEDGHARNATKGSASSGHNNNDKTSNPRRAKN